MADQVALELFNISGKQARADELKRIFSQQISKNKIISFINRKFVKISKLELLSKSSLLFQMNLLNSKWKILKLSFFPIPLATEL